MQTSSAISLLATLLVAGSSMAPVDACVLHKVCYDSDGWLMIEQNDNYRITSHAFFNPTNNSKLDSIAVANSDSEDPFWEIQFTMPAIVDTIVVIGNRPDDLQRVLVTLFSDSRKILHRIRLKQSGLKIAYRPGHIMDVYFIRISRPRSSTLSIADVKIKAKQVLQGIHCSDYVTRISNGCYSLKRATRRTGLQGQDHWIGYECNAGFRLSSSAYNHHHRCNVKPNIKPQCVPVRTCSPPPTVLNSYSNVTQRLYHHRETVFYRCVSGYYLEGSSLLTCTSSGSWNPTQQPVCTNVDVQCLTPSVPKNGVKTGADYRKGQNVTFSCLPGYQLYGTRTIHCASQGRWSPRPSVICKAVKCPEVTRSSVANGNVTLKELDNTGFEFGNFLEVQCSVGFTITGNSVITCNSSGQWDSSLPFCNALNPCSQKNCRESTECVINSTGQPECVCSASLRRGCSDAIHPVCTTMNVTLWSDCHIRNFTCLYPNKKFIITTFAQCQRAPQTQQHLCTEAPSTKCGLPKMAGTCKASFPRFYFDVEQGKCTQFLWGGCESNENNFISERECQEECSDFQSCHYEEKFESEFGINLAKGQPTSLHSIFSSTLVDGSRFCNDSVTQDSSSWTVVLKGPSEVNKIVFWNSLRNLRLVQVVLTAVNNQTVSQILDGNGSCRYDWSPPSFSHARFLRIETFPSNILHLDEVEVYGLYDRVDGTLIDFATNPVNASQGPRTSAREGLVAKAENAVNGIFEKNNGPGSAFLNCAATALHVKKSKTHWFQINLQREYFVTKIVVGLRNNRWRQEWQTGLTAYVSQTPISLDRGNSAIASQFNDQDRCGNLYDVSKGQKPTFSCHADHSSRYVIFTLKPQHTAGIQICEVQVFAITCNPRARNDSAMPIRLAVPTFAPTTFTCKRGYQLNGTEDIHCGKSGQWHPQPSPRCRRLSQTPKQSFWSN